MQQGTEKKWRYYDGPQHVNVDKAQRPPNTCCDGLLHSSVAWMTFRIMELFSKLYGTIGGALDFDLGRCWCEAHSDKSLSENLNVTFRGII